MPLIAYWPFNEDSSLTAFDYSGNNINGVLNGDPTQGVTGVAGGTAYSFNGNDENVNVPSINAGSSYTIACWIKRTSSGNFPQVMGNESHFSVEAIGDENWSVIVGDGSSWDGWRYSNTTISGNTWYHIAYTFESGNITFFTDGQPDGTASNTSRTLNTSFHIGRRKNQNNDYGFPGKIAEVRLYDHALSASEVQYLYSVGKRGTFVSNKRTL